MRAKFAVLVAGAGLLLAAAPMFAHHSFAAQFDWKQGITLKGVVRKVEWTNPHMYFWLDVKDEKGKVVSWILEAGGPNSLTRRGWNRDSLKVGDRIAVIGYRAKGGSAVASARTVEMANGRKVFVGADNDGGPRF